MKKVKLEVKSITQYIYLFNGIFHLTPSEIKILALFIEVQEELLKEKAPLVSSYHAGMAGHPPAGLITREVRKLASGRLPEETGRSASNHIASLKRKKAVIPCIINGKTLYRVNPLLSPEKGYQNKRILAGGIYKEPEKENEVIFILDWKKET